MFVTTKKNLKFNNTKFELFAKYTNIIDSV